MKNWAWTSTLLFCFCSNSPHTFTFCCHIWEARVGNTVWSSSSGKRSLCMAFLLYCLLCHKQPPEPAWTKLILPDILSLPISLVSGAKTQTGFTHSHAIPSQCKLNAVLIITSYFSSQHQPWRPGQIQQLGFKEWKLIDRHCRRILHLTCRIIPLQQQQGKKKHLTCGSSHSAY